MSIHFDRPAATQITVRPEPEARPVPKFQKATLGDDQNGKGFWGEDGFGFDDFVDLINPLQHIPVVSTVYRAITGDEIAPGLQLVGGIAFGGAIGFAATSATLIAEQSTGTSVSKQLAALFSEEAEKELAAAPRRAPQAFVELPWLKDKEIATKPMHSTAHLAQEIAAQAKTTTAQRVQLEPSSTENNKKAETQDRSASDNVVDADTRVLELFEPALVS